MKHEDNESASDKATNVAWFTILFILTIAGGAATGFSFIWLVFAAAGATGLMPWLVVFPLALAVTYFAGTRVGEM